MRLYPFHWLQFLLKLAFLVLATNTTAAYAQQGGCNYAADIVNQAHEKAHPSTDRAQLERYSSLLERATSQCQGAGDAWYYRYLYARQLGKISTAENYRRRAEQFDSEALRRNENPFAPPVASAPRSDSLTSTPKSDGSPGKPTNNVSPYVREKWALVIGISKFRDKNIPPLTYPAKDAKDFADILRDPNYGRFKRENVKVLTDEEATTVEIKKQIDELIGKVQPEDLVVFYLSSHGSPRQSSNTGANYVATYDTELSSLYATSLAMVRLVDDLDVFMKAQRVVIFLDACYSGAAGGKLSPRNSGGRDSVAHSSVESSVQGGKQLEPEGQGISEEILNRIGQSAGRVIIAASRANEVSWESDKLKNGIFTYYLNQALRQNNGLSPIKDVFDSLSTEVAKRAFAEKNQSQHPILVTSDGQDQVDIRLGAAPRVR